MKNFLDCIIGNIIIFSQQQFESVIKIKEIIYIKLLCLIYLEKQFSQELKRQLTITQNND
ncbi:unnamed protein product [Paramecium octaurelia]|uniref:Uncharacterized protein n=1 Tax=Paramecium octaurelia TaxID=43137 RepID=A0A8S1X8T0_PAROT|nr:unnamed protein product [Paramecium octaurelia]